jgi:hypothetical protein
MKKYNFGISLFDFKVSEWEEDNALRTGEYLSQGFYDDTLRAVRGESSVSAADARQKAHDFALNFSTHFMQTAQEIANHGK